MRRGGELRFATGSIRSMLIRTPVPAKLHMALLFNRYDTPLTEQVLLLKNLSRSKLRWSLISIRILRS